MCYKIKNDYIIFTIILITILFLSLSWNYIRLPFHNISYTDSYLIANKINANDDTLRYLIFVGTPLFLYTFLNIFFNSKKFSLNLSKISQFKQESFFNYKAKVIVLLLIFYIILEFILSPYNNFGFYPPIDTLHDGDYLTPLINYSITGGLWTSSLSVHGGADFIYQILFWKLTGLKTIGSAKLFLPVLIFIIKIFSLILSYQFTKLTLLNKNGKIFFFGVFSIFLISLSNYSAPTNYSPISYRDIFTVIFLIFFIEIQLTNKNRYWLHFFLCLTTFTSFIFHFDSGVYLYLILILYTIQLIILKSYKDFLFIYCVIFFCWSVFAMVFGLNEVKEFFDNFFSIVGTMDRAHGLIYPTPFFSIGEGSGTRATRAILLQILASILILKSVLSNESKYPKNYKIIFIFLMILCLLVFKNALGRSDHYHIRMSTDMQLIIIAFYFLNYTIKKINIFLIASNFSSSLLSFIPFVFILFIFFNIYEKPNLKTFNNFNNNFQKYIKSNDIEFINLNSSNSKNLSKFLLEYEYLTKNQNCVQNFTNDLVLSYLLKKQSCTKYFSPWLASSKINQLKHVEKLKIINPNFIIYESPNFTIDNIKNISRLKIVNSYIIKNYSSYRSLYGYKILKKNEF